MSELLPCPFCGSLPDFEDGIQKPGYVPHVECSNEDCPARPLIGFPGTADSVRERWNTRHAAPVVISEGAAGRSDEDCIKAGFDAWTDYMASVRRYEEPDTSEALRCAIMAALAPPVAKNTPLPLPPKDKT